MRTATTAAILFLASSTLFAQADDEQIQRRHKATTPAPGEIRTVSVGEVAFAEFDQTEYLWAELKSDIVAPGQGVILKKGDLLWGQGGGLQARVLRCRPPGPILLYGRGRQRPLRQGPGGQRQQDSQRLRPVPGDLEGGRATRGGSPIRTGLPRRGRRRAPVLGPQVCRRSRPPNNPNEVTYDFKAGEPTSLTFRGVKLEVLEAGNHGMKAPGRDGGVGVPMVLNPQGWHRRLELFS
jgi:hypothetical protein